MLHRYVARFLPHRAPRLRPRPLHSPMSAGLNPPNCAPCITPRACLVLGQLGKHGVITHKIAPPIERGMEPKAIAAITFTNKAAVEMRERVEPDRTAGQGLLVCTFHALGVRLAREDGEHLGLKPSSQHPRQRRRHQHPQPRRRRHSPIRPPHASGSGPSALEGPFSTARPGAAQAKDEPRGRAKVLMGRYQERLTPTRRGFRRPDRPAARSCAKKRRSARKWQRQLRQRAGGRIPGHQRHAVSSCSSPVVGGAAISPPWATTTSRIYGWRGATWTT